MEEEEGLAEEHERMAPALPPPICLNSQFEWLAVPAIVIYPQRLEIIWQFTVSSQCHVEGAEAPRRDRLSQTADNYVIVMLLAAITTSLPFLHP
jgi:hypothetical protein